MKFSKRIQQLQPSMTLAIDATAKAMKAKGEDVIGLGAGEPDFPTPDVAKQAGIDAINNNQTHYTPAGGTDALKDAIVRKFQREYGIDYERTQVVVSVGAKHSFYNLAQVLWEEGDEIIIQQPYWVSYPEMIRLAGATPVIVDTDLASSFKMHPDQLKEAITPNTRAVVLNSPCNPTGSGYTKQEMEALAEIALSNNLLLISDEIYDKIVFDGFEHVCPASFSNEMKKNTVVINGASKSFAMTGWRIGYIAAEEDIVKAIGKLQSQSTSNPTSVAQAATVTALDKCDDDVARMVVEFQKRRDYLMSRYETLEGVSCFNPVGTFYSFPDVSGLYSKVWKGESIGGSIRLCEYLLESVKVAVVPGIAFGADKHVRLSFATSLEILTQALDRIEQAVGEL